MQWLYKYCPCLLLSHMATRIQSARDGQNGKNNFSISFQHQESKRMLAKMPYYYIWLVKKHKTYDTLNVEEREGALYKHHQKHQTNTSASKKIFPLKDQYLVQPNNLRKNQQSNTLINYNNQRNTVNMEMKQKTTSEIK